MCPHIAHTAIYASSYYCIIAIYLASSYWYICVIILVGLRALRRQQRANLRCTCMDQVCAPRTHSHTRTGDMSGYQYARVTFSRALAVTRARALSLARFACQSKHKTRDWRMKDQFPRIFLENEELKDLVHECFYMPWLTGSYPSSLQNGLALT